jgi:hypothetical protein
VDCAEQADATTASRQADRTMEQVRRAMTRSLDGCA